MSAARRNDDPLRLLCLCIGSLPISRLRHGRRRKALLFEGRLTNAGITTDSQGAIASWGATRVRSPPQGLIPGSSKWSKTVHERPWPVHAPMTDAYESPVGLTSQMPDAQHREAPLSFEQAEARQGAEGQKPLSTSLYCDRMDDKKKCTNCGRGTHLRFTRPGYPDVIAGYWKCRRCIRKGTSSEKEALQRMLFNDRLRLRNYLNSNRVEVGGLVD